ncbi:ABC transporter substrate-binding protein [bacterium]|nr:ABC transporter substrate-binding protein [bacterium]
MARKSVASILFAATLVVMVSCGGGGKKTVGIAKFVAHPALDAVEKGIVDEIKAAKPDVEFDQQNSNADMATAAQIAQRFKERKVAVAVGIATPTAQALANQIKDRPVVDSVVTDPVSAGLVESMDKGGANITGTSDMTPVRTQLDLLLSMAPVKRLGHLYASGEANSVALAAIVKQYCGEKGIEYVEATVTNSSEVKSALLSIAGRIDGLYLGNDNTVFSALSAVSEVTLAKKIPLMSADPASAETIPVLAALGYDYYQMGRATGKIVVRILNGEKTKDIPGFLPTDPEALVLVLNQDVAAQIGVKLDPALVERAKVLVAGGKVTKK